MNASPHEEAQARALALASLLVDRYRSYHDHKETMAYGGATLFVGATIAGLVSDSWPPQWLQARPDVIIAALSVLWLFVLVVIKWQLRRRRWAAMRLAGVERLLAKWVCHPPTEAELQNWVPAAEPEVSRLKRMINRSGRIVVVLADHVWPLKGARASVDVGESVYPKAFVDAWADQSKGKGTEALFHEGLVVAAGWACYALLVARTVAGP